MARRRAFAVRPSWMPRARSRGRPASRRVASCWVKATRSRPGTPRERRGVRARLATLKRSRWGATSMGTYASRWSCSTTLRASAASITPSTVWPRRSAALYAKNGTLVRLSEGAEGTWSSLRSGPIVRRAAPARQDLRARRLERAQEVEQVLLLRGVELRVVVDDLIGLGGLIDPVGPALVGEDRGHQVRGTAVVQEEDSLPHSPQGRCPELVSSRRGLRNVVGEPRPHRVKSEVRVEICRLVPKGGHGGVGRVEDRRVAIRAADLHEEVLAVGDGGGAARHRLGRQGRSEEAHEGGELLRTAHGLGGRGGVRVRDVVRHGGELAARRLLALLGEELVRDALLDVVRLAREDQERLVLRLPAEARDRAVVAAGVGRASDVDAVGTAADAESGLAVGRRGEVVQDGAVRDALDQARAEDRRGNPEDDVPPLALGVEVLLLDGAAARVAAPVLSPADDEERVHAAVGRAVRVVFEARLAHGTVERDEVGHRVLGPEGGGEGDLRVHRRARSADRGRLVAAAAAIEIHPR